MIYEFLIILSIYVQFITMFRLPNARISSRYQSDIPKLSKSFSCQRKTQSMMQTRVIYNFQYSYPSKSSLGVSNSHYLGTCHESSFNRLSPQFNRIQTRLMATIVKEGTEIILIESGERGYIVETLKGGWFKCAVKRPNAEDIVLRLRRSKFDKMFSSSTLTTTTPSISIDLIKNVEDTEVAEASQNYKFPVLIPPDRHLNTKNWIIFSDLHVKGSSIETCETVLREVNKCAQQKNAGVIFLGDFWHVRGALSVELLNRVLKVFKTWTQPVIMIPGNHDQVTLGGTIHALEPVMYAFGQEQALLISEPTICLGALWIPYRRDPSLMKSILNSAATNPDINIIFCHADVKGAFMNDGMKCKEGIELSNFPSHIPIFSGHFHKPHTMRQGSSQLRYVGSPYQTSLSEAGQVKYLYDMSCEPIEGSSNDSNQRTWQEKERWAIDVGKKYFKASSVDDLDTLQRVRPGDRVVIPVKIGEDAKADAVMQRLRNQGMEVDLRHESNPRFRMKAGNNAVESNQLLETEEIDKIEKVGDELDPLNIYETFMRSSSVNLTATDGVNDSISQNASWMIYQSAYQEGKRTIERLLGLAEAGHEGKSTAAAFSSKQTVKDLRIDSISIKDFGPYGGEGVSYPIADRGLVLIRGKSSDGTGADSNGSGKTTLAMSIMWCLTGSMDTRLVADGKAVDVAFDTGSSSDRRTAEVIVQGTINHKTFTVTRRRGKKQELLFIMDGTDLSKQAVKDTQATIDDELGIGNQLLQRCCFFGQHSHTMTSLLGLSDKGLKSELGSSSLVDVELWNAALTDIRGRDRSDKARINELNITSKLRLEEIQRSNTALLKAEGEYQEVKKQYDNLLASNPLGRSATNISHRPLSEIVKDLDKTRENVETLSESHIEPIRKELMNLTKEKLTLSREQDIVINKLRDEKVKAEILLSTTMKSLDNVRKKYLQLDQSAKTLSTNIKHMTLALFDGPSSTSPSILSPSSGLQSLLEQLKLPSFQELQHRMKGNEDNIDPMVVSINPEIYREAHDHALSEISSMTVRLNATMKSKHNLEELKKSHQEQQHSHSNLSEKESCPTCGQALSLSIQLQREQELTQTIQMISNDLQSMRLYDENLKKKYELSLRIKSNQDEWKQMQDRLSDLKNEGKPLEINAKQLENQVKEQRISYDAACEMKAKLIQEIESKESIVMNSLTLYETELRTAMARENSLRIEAEQARSNEMNVSSTMNKYESMVNILEMKLSALRQNVKEKQDDVNLLQEKLTASDMERQNLIERQVILERLIEIFGVRGIQHFIFMKTLQQIESIANNYLLVLAEGGIQIALSSDTDADKIIKTILIRSPTDGEYRERALSQLSGGQWRRVSLALDFAFTELIRRRGILRCNVIVLDEILVHLDASGREAVGTVLRAMAKSVGGNKISDDRNDRNIQPDGLKREESNDPIEYVEGEGMKAQATLSNIDTDSNRYDLDANISNLIVGSGAYETVIVILQDLVAMELEEAFDHVDVVVKAGDVSTVLIDGVSKAEDLLSSTTTY